MDLDLRVFSFLFVIFLFFSCTTTNINNSNDVEIKTIKVSNQLKEDNKPIVVQQDNDQAKNNKAEEILSGSISTMSIIGSDLWIGRLGGALYRYNLHTKDIKKFLDDNYSIKDFSIKKIIEFNNKVIALQSDRIILIDKKNEKLVLDLLPIDVARASDIVMYKNKFYISTLGYGLLEYNINNNSYKKNKNSPNFISSLLVIDDNLYIGSKDSGLFIYDLKQQTMLSRRNFPLELFNKNIVKISKYKDFLLLGTGKQGLIKWKIGTNNIDRLYPKESVSFIDINRDVIAISFIGFGIYIETPKVKKFESINSFLNTNNITAICIYENKLISGNIKKGTLIQEINYLND